MFRVGLFYGFLGVAVILLSRWLTGGLPLQVLDARVPLWQSALAGVAVGLTIVGMSQFSGRRYRWAKQLEDNFHQVLGPISVGQAAFMALASGIVEEMWFRGFFFRLLMQGGELPDAGTLALILGGTSLVFGLLHIGPDRSYLPWTVFAIVVGLLFGGMTLWSGDISGAVVAHITVNHFNFLALGREEP